MNLETFFEKFDLFSDAPDAVAKMRDLILQLAVFGKLCPQNSSEEPASALLVKIAGTNKSRYASGEIRLRENARVSEDLEVSVPDGWSSVALGEIADVNWGNTSLTKKSYSESGFTAYSATGPDGWIDHAEFSGPGIVLSAIGARSGKCFLAEGQWTAIKNTITIIPFSPVNNDWLFRAINRENAWKKRGGAQPFIALKDAISLPLLLPPLAEQRRIVAKVDELMALCDRLEAQQQERVARHAALARASLSRFADAPTPANLDFIFHKSYEITPADLRKSILTIAVQGLLVPHDPESVDWETRKLKELTTKIGSGSTPAGGKESYQETGVPLIRSMNVHFGGFVRHGLAFLNDEQAEKLKNVKVEADDVLLNITGASIGRVAIAPQDMEGARVNQHVCILRPTAEIIPQFLELFLASPVVQHLIDDVQVGATREALTKAMIEQFEIPVPSLAEQRRIVAKVDQLMALVDKLETHLVASRATASNLLQAVVAELTTRKTGEFRSQDRKKELIPEKRVPVG